MMADKQTNRIITETIIIEKANDVVFQILYIQIKCTHK